MIQIDDNWHLISPDEIFYRKQVYLWGLEYIGRYLNMEEYFTIVLHRPDIEIKAIKNENSYILVFF